MNKLRNNVIANTLGYGWSGLMVLGFIPLYIRVLGVESWAVISLSVSLQSFFSLFDMGLSTTLNREFARSAGDEAQTNTARRDLLRTLECVYWPIACLLAIALWSIGGPLASRWIAHGSLPASALARAVGLMGIAVALQWPTQLYLGGFRGLERQVLLNAINMVFALLRNAGAAAAIVWVEPSLYIFLLWQVIVSGVQSLFMAWVLWRLLPAKDHRALFVSRELLRIRKFALGIGVILIFSFVLTQADRIVLSRILTLSKFGTYVLAATAAGALSALIQPFFAAIFPRYSGLVARGHIAQLTTLYHQSNQLLAVFVTSATAVLAIYAQPVLQLWTHDLALSNAASPVLTLLVLGTGLNGLLNLPHALQLAYGWTNLAIGQSAIAVLLLLPSMWWMSSHFGGVGAAATWLALNFCNFVITVPLMHSRLLPGEIRQWYLHDIVPPIATAFVAACLCRLFLPLPQPNLMGALFLGAICVFILTATAASVPASRHLIRSSWKRISL